MRVVESVAAISDYQPPAALVLVAAAVALAAIVPWPAWRISRNVVTIAHEGGHALVALAAGRRLSGIRLHSDTSGVTVSRGRPTGIGMVLTLTAGHVVPALLGLGGAAILAAGGVSALLWTTVGLLLAMLIAIRNVYGAVTVVLTGVAVGAVAWFGAALLQAGVAYFFVWFLLLSGLRPLVELQRARRHSRVRDSDVDQLARLTRVPGTAWVGVFGLVVLGAIALGGWWLIRSPLAL